MMDANMIIANNVVRYLKINNKKQTDLAEALGMSRQVVSKMLTGARAINAIELKQIAEFCKVSMELLVEIPVNQIDTNIAHAFMGRVKTEEARHGIELADELIELYLFHEHVNENAVVQMAEWSELS